MAQINYDVIALACQQLSYRDKLRLAQFLIQLARKEEENANPQHRKESIGVEKTKVKQDKQDKQDSVKDIDNVQYIIERLLKLKPVKKKSLVNSIKSMFQFQGGISDSDIDKIIDELQKQKYIKIEQNRILVVVYTERQNKIRIISSRKATLTERRIYEQSRA
jgi:uncharacterized DUF497 family protein